MRVEWIFCLVIVVAILQHIWLTGKFAALECSVKLPEVEMANAAEMLWTVLANVDWSQQSQEWQDAAAKWRDNYFRAAGRLPGNEA